MQNTINSFKWHNWYLIPFIAVSLIIRVVLPFGNVFHDGIIRFNTVDAYYFIDKAQSGIYSFDMWTSILQANNYNIELIAAVLPVLFFYLILLALYFIVLYLFENKMMAGISTALISVMPGELLNRTSLGAADHHALEILLFSYCILCVVAILKADIGHKAFAVFCLVAYTFLYFITWGGALVLPFIIGLFVSVVIVFRVFSKWSDRIVLLSASTIIVVAMVHQFAPHLIDKLFMVLSWNFNNTIMEEMPLLFTLGTIDMTVILQNYAMLFYLGLVGLGILIYDCIRSNSSGKWLLLIWSVVMITLTLAQRRWTYYSEINIAILTIYGCFFLVQRFKTRVITAVLLLLIIFIPSIEQGIMMGLSAKGYITDDMYAACTWLKGEDTSTVLSQWDNGYWIKYYSQMPVYADPGHTDKTRDITNQIFSTHNSTEALNLLNSIGCKYVLLDEITVKGLNLDSRSFINQLWYCQNKDLELVYSNYSVMIYKY